MQLLSTLKIIILFFPLLILSSSPKKLTLMDKELKLHKNSLNYFTINFRAISLLSSYYIAVDGKEKDMKEI